VPFLHTIVISLRLAYYIGIMSKLLAILGLFVIAVPAVYFVGCGGDGEVTPAAVCTPTVTLSPVITPVVTPTPDNYVDGVVEFPDPNMEAVIRKGIKRPEGDIYISDMRGITMLDGAAGGIKDLTGIEHCLNLAEFTIDKDWVEDISPLSGLTSLRGLNLSYNGITDITPLSGLINLNRLYLVRNHVTDISPLLDNSGLGEGDIVDLRENPLSAESINEYIPVLRSRGVEVRH